jgi:putative nucleotidyltransferase with HDIG domain
MTVSAAATAQVATDNARAKIQTLFSYLSAQGQGDYIGEAVSQLEHSLQAAALASAAGVDDSTILAALLHDVGRFIPAAKTLPPLISADGRYIGTKSHEAVGEKYLRGLGFPRKVYEIVGAHVWAKRYLCATEPGYWEALSKSSKASLELQVRQNGNPYNMYIPPTRRSRH